MELFNANRLRGDECHHHDDQCSKSEEKIKRTVVSLAGLFYIPHDFT